MIVAILNESIGSVFMPLHLAVMMGFTVAAGYSFIRFATEGILVSATTLSICGGLGVYYLILFGSGADLLALGTKMVEVKRSKATSKEQQKFLRSCKSFQLAIGEFTKLDRNTLVNVLQINVDNLASFLLM